MRSCRCASTVLVGYSFRSVVALLSAAADPRVADDVFPAEDTDGAGALAFRMGFDAVIGVDCATKPESIGLARAVRADTGWRLTEVVDGSRRLDPAATVVAWLEDTPRALVALDAPLGWPRALGASLVDHDAGDSLRYDADELFSRDADRHVHALYGKKPLEVGAGWIARTAVAALGLLHEVRARTGHRVPLLWDPSESQAAAAIEVYPAATLRAHGVRAGGYKKDASGPGRASVGDLLARTMVLSDGFDATIRTDDAIDAALCVLAGIDVASGRAIAPSGEQLAAARREGWIWVARPES